MRFDDYKDVDGYEFGYMLEVESWRKGYATEIASAQIKKIEELFAKSTIFATTHPDNVVSRHILQKVGMKIIDRAVNKYRGLRDIYQYM